MIHTMAILPLHLSRKDWAEKASMIGHTLRAHWQREEGQDMVEYALLLGFVALVGVSMLSGIRTAISSIWTQVNDNLATGAS